MIYFNRRLHPYFKLRDDNIHFTELENNFLGFTAFIKTMRKYDEWQESDLYKEICDRLYKEGVEILNNWDNYIKELDDGLIWCHERFSRRSSPHTYKEAREEHYKVYNYVFGGGFENFMRVTTKYGNNINGTQFIYSTFKEGVYYEVEKPFTGVSYLDYMADKVKVRLD